MGSYLSVNDADKKIMLGKIGVSSVMELYRDVPQDLILNGMGGINL